MPISVGADSRAAVFGYGVEGRAALAWLLRIGAVARVVAPSRPAELDSSVAFCPEANPAAALAGIDVIVKSPGIKPSHPLLAEAARRGVAIASATSIFVDRARAARLAVVGVTGSKGKSTTATLIHRTLEAADVPTVLVGNIGRCALDLIEPVTSARPVVVFEMSSYQAHDLQEGPSVAVVTRLFPEHLDWHGSAEAYYAAKLRVASTQRPDDATIYNAEDPEIVRRLPLGPGRHVPVGTRPLQFSDAGMKLRGAHNRTNAALALAAAEMFGARAEHLEAVLASFDGLPHRLEDLGLHGGVRWVNDSIATAPEAAVAALEALGGDVATYIGGGLDRGYDFAPLARALVSREIANVIVVPPGGGRIVDALAAIAPRAAEAAHAVEDLGEAVALAARLTPKGKTVLLSPASPSYGTFRNFEERGDVFRSLVKEIP